MIDRKASTKLLQLAHTFKSVAVTGPHQSGKTTLVKSLFPDKPYVSLENPETRRFALEDPRGLLDKYPDGAILDEVQRAPELFSYLQEILDDSPNPGKFILTGSNNFLLQQNIVQTLAGRIALMNLLPFSLEEIYPDRLNLPGLNNILLTGLYPPLFDLYPAPQDWFPNYIRTYVERDVRQIRNITDLVVFERFMGLLAARTGQELNLSSLAVETGMDTKTIQSWVSVLDGSYIIYLLRPHYRNFNKTIIKRPKVYFYDTGLICSLLGIRAEAQLENHPIRGSLFETLIVTELVKKRINAGVPVNLYYWRDKTGHEVDLIIDQAGQLTPMEIKSGKTINEEFFKNLIYWNSLSGESKGYLIYGGGQEQHRSHGLEVVPWVNLVYRDF